MPMKQNLLSQIETNYQISEEYDSKKQANIQIDILKEIAIKGKQTKPELVESLGHTYRTIAITLSRDENKTIENKNLFRRNGSTFVKGIDQSQYSLTNRAIPILMLGRYKNNDENKKLNLAEKPYLNFDEFLEFCSIFEKKHSYEEITKSKYRLRQPIYPFISLYLSANPSTIKQLGSKYKTNKELQNLVSLVNSDELKIKKMEKRIGQLKDKIIDKQFKIGEILPDTINSLKK